VAHPTLTTRTTGGTPTSTLGGRGEVTRQKILKAAAQLFLEQGFEATSVNAIARAAQVSVPSLYWHFESKTDICFTFLELSMSEFAEAVLGEPDVGEPDERLRQFVRRYVRAQLADHASSTAYEKLYTFGQLSNVLDDEHRDRLVAVERGIIQRLRQILRDGKSAGVFAVADVKLAAFAIASACEYAFGWYRHDGPLSVEQVADHYALMMEALARNGTPGGPCHSADGAARATAPA
jgi:AcrR family transcriptional regulator